MKNPAQKPDAARQPSRRIFLPAAAAFAVTSRRAFGSRRKSPNETLNIAGIGVGGMGAGYVRECASENIVALCDVDSEYAARTYSLYPNAKTYRDYRKMLDQRKDIDAVIIGTPDHSHAVIALAAMKMGKHVYCAKPLTRTIEEARTLARVAREEDLATQMSVQSSMSDKACSTVEWIQAGAVGPVREVHVWSDRPIWPQGAPRPKDTPAAPKSLDWNLWLGPAPERPYHPAYHPFSWRGWWDFGTGAMGDMGCHTLHVIVRALNLEHPVSVSATSAAVVRGLYAPTKGLRPKPASLPETAPHSAIITWNFPARGDAPPVRVTWYDGGLKPPRPLELEPERELDGDGILFVGDKGVLLSGFTGGPALLPESRNKEYQPPEPSLPRTIGHYQEWIEACKGGKPASCEFGFGGMLTEIGLLGNLAVRAGKLLTWDPVSRKTNDADANRYISEPARPGWELPA
ncbi:MAG: Gfo/Idh/MocA family oxidoreductase [Bryobacteraceae bacterium]|nr:Gfo/Idh/MocA family oxidoreductase [Bryobacteraceae bacterium]